MAEHPMLDELPAYALGALPDDERRVVDGHLAEGCRVCREELASLDDTVAQLAYDAPARALPPGLKRRLVARVELEAERSPRPRDASQPSPFPPPGSRPERRASLALALPLAAALLLAAGLGFAYVAARQQAERLAAELATTRAESVKLTETLAARTAETAWMKDPRVQIALLKGLAGAEQAKARLLFHPETKQAVLYVAGLPPLPLTKSYELWAFVGDVPKPAGTFDAGAGTVSVVSLADVSGGARPTKFAVSIEPRGGMPSPTGSVVLAGETF